MRPSTGPVELPVPAGEPVHCVAAGVVSAVDDQAVGEVVVRCGDELHHYRHLMATSLRVGKGQVVEAGNVVGVVAPMADGRQSTLVFGIQGADGRWLDPFAALVAAGDPAELRLPVPSVPGPAGAAREPDRGPTEGLAARVELPLRPAPPPPVDAPDPAPVDDEGDDPLDRLVARRVRRPE